MTKEDFTKGLIFEITKKTKYETLPQEGIFEIIHVGTFDGERFSINEYSPTVQCMKYEDGLKYTIEEKIYEFYKRDLVEYEKNGYLTIHLTTN